VKENSIGETIKQLKLMLKVRKEQKEIIECAGGSCINCDPDIKALSESIDILSDYKRVLKENEELKKFHIQDNKHLDFIMQHCIPVQKVKDKIEELQKGPLKINENNKYYYETEAYNKIIIQVLQELLEGRK
jgi:predicted metal-binding protein